MKRQSSKHSAPPHARSPTDHDRVSVSKEAFASLYQTYAPRVEAFVMRLTGDREVARDVVQETFLRAYRSLHRYQPKTSIVFWLLAIARNLVVSRARREKKLVPLAQAQWIPHPTTPLEEVDRAWRLRRLAVAIRRLQPRERAALHAFYVEQQPIRAIAASWGTTENAVKLVLSRARRKLRSLLE